MTPRTREKLILILIGVVALAFFVAGAFVDPKPDCEQRGGGWVDGKCVVEEVE